MTRSRKQSAWRRGFKAYRIILWVVFAGALIWLWFAMAEYQVTADSEALEAQETDTIGTSAKDREQGERKEKEVPKETAAAISEARAAQECFQKYLFEMDEKDWVRVWKENYPVHFDSDEDIAALIKSRLTDKGYESYRLDMPDDAPVFILKTDEGIPATFTLSGSGGNYSVEKIELDLKGPEKVHVVAAEGVRIMFNGLPVPDSMTDELSPESEVPVPGYEEKLTGRMDYRSYDADGLITVPSVTAEHDGETYDLSQDAEGRYVYILKDEGQFRSRAEAFVKALLFFYANGKTDAEAHMNAALAHVAGGSKASFTIYAALDGVQWKTPDHTAVYETETSPVYVLSENCYAVDVRYTDNGLSEPVTECYRVYFLNNGKGFNIVQFAMGELGNAEPGKADS